MMGLSIFTAIGLGALHALEPGHGKSFLASYAIGNEIDTKKTIALITSLALSHSVLLILLALFIPIYFKEIEESVHLYIVFISSAIILFIGGKMLYRYIFKTHHENQCSCGHDHNALQTEHKWRPPSKPTDKKSFTAATFQPIAKEKKRIQHTWGAIVVGLVNGIMPCPSALAVIGIAFTQSSLWSISFTMLSYVIGFVLAMLSLLLLVLLFKNKLLNKLSNHSKTHKRIELISSVLIIASGCYYLFLASHHVH